MAPNMYHWISSHPFELRLKRYRLNAFPALIRHESSTIQSATMATRALSQSMALLSASRDVI